MYKISHFKINLPPLAYSLGPLLRLAASLSPYPMRMIPPEPVSASPMHFLLLPLPVSRQQSISCYRGNIFYRHRSSPEKSTHKGFLKGNLDFRVIWERIKDLKI